MNSEEYLATIEECAAQKKNLVILNSHALHASFLLKTFFKFAQSEVFIYTGQLYPGVYDNPDLIKEAIEFLKNTGKKIHIAIQESVKKEEVLSRGLIKGIIKSKDRKGDLLIWDVSGRSLPISENHFAVMDDHAYRFENDHSKRSAVANFGDAKTAEILKKFFQIITMGATPISIKGNS